MKQISFLILLFFFFGFSTKQSITESDLVKSNKWFIAGPAKENEETINSVRLQKGIILVTAKDNSKGEIELNVMITPSETNDGATTNLSSNSKYVKITYQSSQLIKLQAREGDASGAGCVHGGSHPRVDLPASPKRFTTIKIPWTAFRQDGLEEGKLLNIHNLCKFNFVNYNPVSGSVLKIKSVIVML